MKTPIVNELNKQKLIKQYLGIEIPKWCYLVGYFVGSTLAFGLPFLFGSKSRLDPVLAGCLVVIFMLVWSVFALQNKLNALVEVIGEDEINKKLSIRMKHVADSDINKVS